MKKILFLAFLIFLDYNYVSSQEVVIKFKINNQIITNLDIQKEAEISLCFKYTIKKS